MSDENATTTKELQGLAAKLVRRRNRIAKVQSSFAVLVGAYDLVAADIRSAAAGESNPAAGGETTTAA
jgi:hypothetical protein